MKKLVISIFLTLALANGLFTSLFAQESKSTGMENMPGMSSVATDQAMHSMEGQHMNMGPHMKMTALRAAKPGDDERAQQIVETARKVAEKYSDYRVALANGFHIFMPDVPQHQYHFNNVE